MPDEFDLTSWLNEPVKVLEPAQPVGEVEKPALSQAAIKLLSFCEQTFWETGLLPTPEACSEALSVSSNTCRKWFADETFKSQLAARGMDPAGLVTVGKVIKETKALSAQQIVVANMMLNLHDKRSEREKLLECQVSSQQYHAWLRQPAFVEFLRKRGEALFSSSDFIAYKSLIRNVSAGDNKALELFFEMRGIYKKSLNVNLNIEAVLTKVVEVISTHVKDPKVLQAIAVDLEGVVEGEEVA